MVTLLFVKQINNIQKVPKILFCCLRYTEMAAKVSISAHLATLKTDILKYCQLQSTFWRLFISITKQISLILPSTGLYEYCISSAYALEFKHWWNIAIEIQSGGLISLVSPVLTNAVVYIIITVCAFQLDVAVLKIKK